MQISALYNIIFIIVFIGYFSLTPSPAAATPHPSTALLGSCAVLSLSHVGHCRFLTLLLLTPMSTHKLHLSPVRGIHTRQQLQQQQTKTGKYCCRLHAKEIYGLGSLVIAAKQAGNIQWENNNIHLRLFQDMCCDRISMEL